MSDTERQEIACPYCGESILAVAKKCKHCDEWLGEQKIEDSVKVANIVTTEQTGKRYKAIQLMGTFLAIIGAILLTVDPTLAAGGSLCLFIGLTLFLIGRVGGWWHHG